MNDGGQSCFLGVCWVDGIRTTTVLLDSRQPAYDTTRSRVNSSCNLSLVSADSEGGIKDPTSCIVVARRIH